MNRPVLVITVVATAVVFQLGGCIRQLLFVVAPFLT